MNGEEMSKVDSFLDRYFDGKMMCLMEFKKPNNSWLFHKKM